MPAAYMASIHVFHEVELFVADCSYAGLAGVRCAPTIIGGGAAGVAATIPALFAAVVARKEASVGFQYTPIEYDIGALDAPKLSVAVTVKVVIIGSVVSAAEQKDVGYVAQPSGVPVRIPPAERPKPDGGEIAPGAQVYPPAPPVATNS
jgi:hypothetical protein